MLSAAMIQVRLGARLAFGPPPSLGRLRWSGIAASVVLALAACWCLSFARLAADATTRTVEHRFREALPELAEGANGDRRVAVDYVRFRGRDILVVAVAVSNNGGPLPRSMNRFPRPGSAVASPALLDAVGGQRAFTERFGWPIDSDLHVRWAQLIPTQEDWVVFTSAPKNRDLGAGPVVRRFDIGAGTPNDRARGATGTNGRVVAIAEDRLVPTFGESLWHGLWLVGVPAGGLSVALLLGDFDVRSRRATTLRRLGARPVDLLALGIGEAVVVAAVPATVVVIGWSVATRRWRTLPGTRLGVWRSGLVVPPGWLAAVVAGVVVVVALVTSLAYSRRGRRARYAAQSVAVAVPLLTVGLSRTLDPTLAVGVFAAGFVLTLLWYPSIVATALPGVGSVIARHRSAGALIAGRRLEVNAPQLARAVGLAGVAALSSTLATGFFATLKQGESTPSSGVQRQELYRWWGMGPADVAEVRQLLPGHRVQVTRPIERVDGTSAVVALVDEALDVTSNVSISVKDEQDAESVLRALRRKFGLASCTSCRAGPSRYHGLRWIGGLLPVTFVGLGLAAMVVVDSRRRRLPRSDARLLRQGASEPDLSRIARLQFEVPLVISVGIGVTLGTLFCWAGIDIGLTGLPWSSLALLTVGSIALFLVPMEVVGAYRARAAARGRHDIAE